MKKLTSLLLTLLMFLTSFNSSMALNNSGNTAGGGFGGIKNKPNKGGGNNGGGNNGGGNSNSGGFNGVSNNRPGRVTSYTVLDQVSGSPSIELAIATRDLALDLLKRDKAIFRIRDARQLIKTNQNTGSIGLAIYEQNRDGTRGELISTQQVAIGTSRSSRQIFISQDLGRFATLNPTKNIEIDVLASDRSVAGTFKTIINATNPQGQVGSVQSDAFDCTNVSVEDCIRKFFIEKVDVIPDPTRNRAATVLNNEFTDNIEIKVPVIRNFVKFKAGRRKLNVNGGNNGGGNNGGGVASFGETLDITRIRLGDSLADFANFRYDPTGGKNNGHFILSSGVNGNPVQDNFFFSDTGKLGIGVPTPSAFLDVRGGTSTMPQMRLNPGVLTANLVNGALEFDGNELYLTKNGVRRPIGSQVTNIFVNNGSINSATFVNGDIAKSTLTNNIIKNNTVDGKLSFTKNGKILGDLTVNGVVTATKFMGNGSMLTNIPGTSVTGSVANALSAVNASNATTANISDRATSMVAGTISNSTFTGGTINGANLVNVNITGTVSNATKLVSPNGAINPAVSVANSGNVEVTQGNLTVNGNVIADRFVGNGSMLTNIPGTSVTGSVANALSAVNASNATTANIADSMVAGRISNSTFTGGTINGATLKNIDLSGVSITNLANNSVNTSNIVNGTITTVDLANNSVTSSKIVNGSIATADLANGSVTDPKIVSVSGSKITGAVANATNATTVNSGTITNSTFTGGTINGATLRNIDLSGVSITNLANNSVNSSNIVNGTITTVDLANNSVTSSKIVNGTIATADLANGSVTDPKIVSVSGSKITGAVANATNATTVNSGTITNSTFTGGTINGATLRNIDLSGVSITNLANNSVNTSNIVNGTITTVDLANNSVTSSKIVNGTIATADLANGSVTDPKIVSVSGSKVTGTVANATNAVTATNATNASNLTGTITTANLTGQILGGVINGATLRNVNLSGVSITNVANADTASVARSIINNSINSSKIVNGSVATVDLADASVTDAKIVSVSATKITGTVANATNALTAQTAVNATNATNVSGGTITNSTIRNGVINGATLVNVNISGTTTNATKLVSPNGLINPAVSVANNGNVEVTQGNFTVNGNVTADKFIGDGSLLTNIAATNVTGTVANATNALTAQTAVNATNATNATNVSGGTITNSTIRNGVINGATLVNVNITGTTTNATKLVSPNGLINPAVSVANNGNVEVTRGNFTVNGNVTADKFIGDGSLLTNIAATNVTGTVANATNALTAQTAVTAQSSGSSNTAFRLLSPNSAIAVVGTDNNGDTFVKRNLRAENIRVNQALNVDGNVAIGTATPASKFHVSSNDNTRAIIETTSTDPNTAHPGLLLKSPTSSWLLQNQGSSRGNFWLHNQTRNIPSLVVDKDSNFVAIGANLNPTEALDVVGNVKANQFIGDGSRLTNISSTSHFHSDIRTPSGELRVVADPGEGVRIHKTLTIGSGFGFDSNTGGVVLNNEKKATGYLRVSGSTDDHLLSVNSQVDNVGIGASNPLGKLHVSSNKDTRVIIESTSTNPNTAHPGLLFKSPTSSWLLQNQTSSKGNFWLYNQNRTIPSLVVDKDSNFVAIGANYNPTEALDVSGNIKASGDINVMGGNFQKSVSAWNTRARDAVIVGPSDDLGASSHYLHVNGSAHLNRHRNNTGSFLVSGPGDVHLLHVRYDNAKVGIGHAVPAAKLDVNGGVKVGYSEVGCQASTAGTIHFGENRMYVCATSTRQPGTLAWRLIRFHDDG